MPCGEQICGPKWNIFNCEAVSSTDKNQTGLDLLSIARIMPDSFVFQSFRPEGAYLMGTYVSFYIPSILSSHIQ